MNHNPSVTPKDFSGAGAGAGSEPHQAGRKTERQKDKDMVHEAEVAASGQSRRDGSAVTAGIHERQKQDPYFTGSATQVPRNRSRD